MPISHVTMNHFATIVRDMRRKYDLRIRKWRTTMSGCAWRVYHASSGKPSTPTVFGTYRFYRKSPGTNSEGMVNSNYFVRGYAIHGYHSVPPFAASHGCIRIPIPNSRQVYDWIPLGMRIFAYR